MLSPPEHADPAREHAVLRPFQISVHPHLLDDLAMRLDRARSRHNPLSKDSGWDYGTDPGYLHDLATYWRTHYDWRRHEQRLNDAPQFMATFGATQLHFAHVEGQGPQPMPLLLLHGWPDSFDRFHKVLPIFADPASRGGDPLDAFQVVIPSLPGFGFTRARDLPREQPLRHTAALLHRLMTEVLGYERFAVAGGDGGSPIAQILAIDYPDAVAGIHLTDLGWHALQADPGSLSRAEQKYLESAKKQFMADGAYAMIQTTYPRSLAALNDSPLGLASWIIDRFHSWCDGELETCFARDDLLTNIMLYWVTQTIDTSIYQYYLEAKSPSLKPENRVDRPVGLALFPKDIGGVPPVSFAERTLNVQRWTEMPRGGHFAALEQPSIYAADVVEFFRSLRAS